MKTAEDLKNEILKAGWGAEQDFLGCSQEDIRYLEETLSAKLPHEYKSFLSVMGHKAAALSMYDAMNLGYDQVLSINEPSKVKSLKQAIYNELATKEGWNGGWEQILLICMRQGYDMFIFIYANGEKDSSVFFNTGRSSKKIGDSLSAFYEFVFDDASQLLSN